MKIDTDNFSQSVGGITMGNYFEDRNHTREIRVLEQELAKLKEENKNLKKENDELKKKTGYSTSLFSSTCNNCGHRDCD